MDKQIVNFKNISRNETFSRTKNDLKTLYRKK